jgi:hypothetical protein
MLERKIEKIEIRNTDNYENREENKCYGDVSEEVEERKSRNMDLRIRHTEMEETVREIQLSIASSRPGRPLFERGEGRVIHFIDIENIAKSPRLTEAQVRLTRALYIKSGLYKEGDLVFIACGQANSAAVGFGWPSAHRTSRPGRDGADFELIEAIKREKVSERFDRAVIASGDGIFTTRAEILRRQGVEVTVVAPPKGLSTRLRGAASRTVLIDTERLSMFFLANEESRLV